VLNDPQVKKQKDTKPKTNYQKQKQQASTYFRVASEDTPKITSGQYTLYDFIDNAFSFSDTRKELAINVLECLKQKPLTFAELQKNLKLKKSTLYLLLISLAKSGLISCEQGRRNQPIALSTAFSQTLEKNASWWRAWVETKS
jgi:DNA-binding HxlR family transcriptional regulator